MLGVLSKYIVAILGMLVLMLSVIVGLGYWKINSMQSTIDKQNIELGVVSAMSQNQEIKIVESKQIEERIKVLTQDKIKYVTEYIYDENKTECDNAIDRMRIVF